MTPHKIATPATDDDPNLFDLSDEPIATDEIIERVKAFLVELRPKRFRTIEALIARIESDRLALAEKETEIRRLNKKYDDDMKEYGRRLQVVIDLKKDEIQRLKGLCGEALSLIHYARTPLCQALDRASKGSDK